MEVYYTIYKITNKLNGKIYIGSHKTKDLNDGYMGSGKYLKRAIKQHGLENFSKEILHVFSTPEEMYTKEAELVNEEFIETQNTYNLKVGGFGGFDWINSNQELVSERNRKILSVRKQPDPTTWVDKALDSRGIPMIICPNCQKEFRRSTHRGVKYCSRSCAATINNRGRNRHGKNTAALPQ